MDKLVVDGGGPLAGTVQASGAKNAALPLMAATLLAEGPCTLHNVPDLSDIRLMRDILAELGVTSTFAGGTLTTEVVDETCSEARYELVSQMRASFCVLGPLTARRRRARVSLPGGCVIGVRPVELHLKGLRALGAKVSIEHGDVVTEAPALTGAPIFVGGPFGSSVTGTANVLMAAVLASGTTVIEPAACEPEIEDLCRFLVAMGARIDGLGSPRLTITGVTRLTGARHRVIGDRIEAATYLIAGALPGGDVTVTGCPSRALGAVLEVLRTAGATIEAPAPDSLRVLGPERLRAVDVTTLPYPGFPTDAQAPLMAALTRADGISVITERIYPDRFMHVAEFNRMGARIRKIDNHAIVAGTDSLSGAPVMASDLRAGAALVLAGLMAEGETEVHRVYHIDRGYERLEAKLGALGASVRRESYAPQRRRTDGAPADAA